MPYSVRENDEFVLNLFYEDSSIQRVLDVGVGSGTYGRLLKGAGAIERENLHGVEVWEPYEGLFGLHQFYGRMIYANILTLTPDDLDHYDLIIFGDVLEHIDSKDLPTVWRLAEAVADRVLISLPKGHWPQTEGEHGNPYEAHVDGHVTGETLVSVLPDLSRAEKIDFEDTTTFFMRFR